MNWSQFKAPVFHMLVGSNPLITEFSEFKESFWENSITFELVHTKLEYENSL